MLTLFFRLYLLLALVIGGYLAAASLYSGPLLQGTIADYIHDITRGTYALVMRRLQGVPPEQWPQAVARLGESFGYPIALLEARTLALSVAQQERLRAGRATYEREQGTGFWYVPLAGSDWVLRVQMGETEAEHGEAMAIGTFRLIEEALAGTPEADLPRALEALRPLFRYPLALEPPTLPGLDPAQRERLRQGRVVAVAGTGSERYYRRLGETGQVLRLGPMVDPLVVRNWGYIVYTLLAALVGMSVWLWVRPLWRNVQELRRVTAALGRGELAVRARMSAGAPLAILGQTFNHMAGRIQGLIASHRDLTNAVSHELRTPIARLRFALEMLEQADPSARARHLASIHTDVDELEALVEELLTFARFEREQPALRRERGALAPWLRRLCERHVGEPGGAPVGCDVDGLPAALEAQFDPRLLARAVDNLVRNARRYAVTTVRVSAVRAGPEVAILVDDDGPGIPPPDRARLFEPFTRLDHSRDRESGGYGLGLAIVKRIAELHGGSVDIEESPLGGARFRLTWPAA